MKKILLLSCVAILFFGCDNAPVVEQQALSTRSFPTVIVKPINPVVNGNLLTVDIAIKGDQPGYRLFGMNVRFFIDNAKLKFLRFDNFEGGYEKMSPNPPMVNTMKAGSGLPLFGFNGTPVYINGAVQLLSNTLPPVFISDTSFTKIFSIVFEIKQPDSCPMVILDKESVHSRGGFPPGSAGLVVTLVAVTPGMESRACIANCEHLNWGYTGNGLTMPYGQPNQTTCINQ